MAYQVIARKWRPQRFADLVGQEHIAQTLKNAITSGRVAHAYLFVGPRGIGKTTSARIFAKALNCLRPVDGEPCCECSSCKAIAEESSVDVIEIDAATHTQVEKAREICEEALHLPISSKFKIFIIDEVHMLSKQAWNALLKTIEEPPAHAKFIFATTEVNKVLPTVISRCQRFDLRRIPTKLISGRLNLIAKTEGVKISPSAIDVIARAADGGMRDAQSLLDQLISFFGADGSNEISEEQALSLFGLTAPVEMEKLMGSLLSGDKASVILSISAFAEKGKNLEVLFEEILSWLRGIMLCKILKNPEMAIEESQDKIELFRKIAASSDQAAIQRLLEQLSSTGYLLREAINKQVFIETILLKAMRIAHAVQIEDLIARLNIIRRTGELPALDQVQPIGEAKRVQQIAVQPAPAAIPSAPAQEPDDIKKKSQTPVAETPKAEPAAQAPAPKSETPAPKPVVPAATPASTPAPAPVQAKAVATPAPKPVEPVPAPAPVQAPTPKPVEETPAPKPPVEPIPAPTTVQAPAPKPVEEAPAPAPVEPKPLLTLTEKPLKKSEPGQDIPAESEPLREPAQKQQQEPKSEVQPVAPAPVEERKPQAAQPVAQPVVETKPEPQAVESESKAQEPAASAAPSPAEEAEQGQEAEEAESEPVVERPPEELRQQAAQPEEPEEEDPRKKDTPEHMQDLKAQIKENQFVQDTLNLFNGKIADIHG